MIDLQAIVAHNKHYVEEHRAENEAQHLTSKPKKKLAIVTCMDTRLVNLLEDALGFERGEVIVIKVAGNGVTAPVDNVVQSLLIATYGMGVEDILVVGHDNCGMIEYNAEEFIKNMVAQGISKEAIRMIEMGLVDWMDHFCVSEDNVKFTVDRLRKHPLFPNYMNIYGGMMNPDTGEFKIVEP